jgi:hypothetical protein
MSNSTNNLIPSITPTYTIKSELQDKARRNQLSKKWIWAILTRICELYSANPAGRP